MTEDAPMSTAVRIVGILLIVQAVLRVGLSFFNYAGWQFAIQRMDIVLLVTAFILPLVIAVAAGVAGILMAQLLPVARPFGIAICAIGLAFQTYGLATLAYRLMAVPTLRVAWIFPVLSVAYFAVFLAGLICLIQWRPRITLRGELSL
jgi:hypothetical protein